MTTPAKSRGPRARKPPRVIDTPFINLDELPDERLSAARLYEIELYNHSRLAPSLLEEARGVAARARAGEKQAREDMVVACLRYVFHVGHGLALQHGITEMAADVVFDTQPQRLADINRAMYGHRGGTACLHLSLAVKSLRCHQTLREMVPGALSSGESLPTPRKRGRPAKARKDQ